MNTGPVLFQPTWPPSESKKGPFPRGMCIVPSLSPSLSSFSFSLFLELHVKLSGNPSWVCDGAGLHLASLGLRVAGAGSPVNTVILPGLGSEAQEICPVPAEKLCWSVVST